MKNQIKRSISLTILLILILLNVKGQTEFLVTVDPSTGTISKVDSLPGVKWITISPTYSSLDKINNSYMFRGNDNSANWYLYSVDCSTGNIFTNPNFPVLTDPSDNVIQLEYDNFSGIMYGLHWSNSEKREYLVEVNPTIGVYTNIDSLPGVNAITTMPNYTTFDEKNNLYIFRGRDKSGKWYLYSVDCSNGKIVSNPLFPVLTDPSDNLMELKFDNSNGIMYGLHWKNAEKKEYLVRVDPNTGAYIDIDSLPGVKSITTLPHYTTFDEINNRYIFRGSDQSGKFYLYSVNVNNGKIVSKPPFPVLTYTADNVIELQNDNSTGILYALHWQSQPISKPLLQGSLSANGPFCGTGTGELTWTSTAGVEPFTVTYYDGISDRVVKGVKSGVPFNIAGNPVTKSTIYTLVSVKDTNGTRDNGFTQGTAAITVKQGPVIIKDTIPDQTICQGKSVTFSIEATGDNLHYQWTKGGLDITGATESVYFIPNGQPTDYNYYSCKVSNDCDTIQLKPFILNIISPPKSNTIFVKQLKNLGDSVSYALSPGGTGPFTYQWLKNGKNIQGASNSIYNIKSIICGDTGTYTCSMGNKCDTIIVKVAQLYVNCSRYWHGISGYVRYENKDSTAMSNTNVYITNASNQIVGNTITDAKGKYVFTNLINGIYKLTCSTTKAWGGSNPVDALMVNRSYIGLYNITDPLKLLAANINGDKKINPVDALMINRRYIGLLKMFNISDWLFDTTKVTISGADIPKNIRAICAGDVNGSYVPPARIMNYELGIRNDKEIQQPATSNQQTVDIPVYYSPQSTGDRPQLGAMGVQLRVMNYELGIIGVKSDLEGLIYNVINNGVNVAWSSFDEGYAISPDKPLFVVSCSLIVNSKISNKDFQITSESVLADIEGNYISTDKLAIPSLIVHSPQSTANLVCFPNPFNQSAIISYQLPEDGNVEINIYNVLEEKIAELISGEFRKAGQHNLQYNASGLREGIYYCVLKLTNKDLQLSKTNIMVIVR